MDNGKMISSCFQAKCFHGSRVYYDNAGKRIDEIRILSCKCSDRSFDRAMKELTERAEEGFRERY